MTNFILCSDKNVVLNLNGKTITNTTGYYAVYNEWGDVSGVVGGTISSKNF